MTDEFESTPRPDSAGRRGAPPVRGRGRGAPASSAVPVRRSSRLSTTSAVPESREMMPPPTRGGGGADGGEPGAGAARALWLLRQLANGYRLLCQYKCQDAVTAFKALPLTLTPTPTPTPTLTPTLALTLALVLTLT